MTIARTNKRNGAWGIHALGAIWGLALFVGGMLQLEEPTGIVMLVAACVVAVIVVLAIARGSWMQSLFGVLITTGFASVAAGVVGDDMVLVAAGIGVAAVVSALAPIAISLRRLVDTAGTPRETAPAPASPALELAGVLDRLHETSMLSDNAKRVLFRKRELELLRHAIEEDMTRGDHDAAMTMCDALGSLFGYREEAETYRGQIMGDRRERYEADVTAAVDNFDQLLVTRDWGVIHQEAERLRRLYPDSHLVQELDQRVLTVRDDYKRELEREFLQAAEANRIGEAMGHLRHLDRYLSTEEAEGLSEIAQGVITRHRDNLSVQFREAVNDHRWSEAAAVGDRIIAEFPNTKMAGEVRSMIDVLRTRATEAAVTAAEGQPG